MSKIEKKIKVQNYSRDELWAFYSEIGLAERHFNTIQEKYRLLSSTWLLGAIAAIAYVFVHQKDFPFPATELGAVIAFLSSFGISFLWILDIKVYQSLLSSYYQEGLLLEQGQPWLPPIRLRIRRRFKGNLPILISLYYIGSMLFLFIIGIVLLLLSINNNWTVELTVVSILGFLSACANGLVIRYSRQPKAILRQEDERLRAYQRVDVSFEE